MVQGGVAELSDKLDRYRTIGYGNDMLTVRAIKVYADGAMGSRGAWLLEPYADKPDSVGLPRPDMATLPQVARLAVERGYQLAVHAIGDRANREVLNVYEAAFKAAGRSGRGPALARRARAAAERRGYPPVRRARRHRVDAAGARDLRWRLGR